MLITAGCEPLHLSNGDVSYNKDKVNGRYPTGTRATHSCNSGYILGPIEKRGCLANGMWSEWPAGCIEGECISNMWEETGYILKTGAGRQRE